MRSNFKGRLDTIHQIVSPTRTKELSELTDNELMELLLSLLDGAGKNGGPLTVEDLTDEKLNELMMEGRQDDKKPRDDCSYV